MVRGHTVDISESGISAMLRVEVPIGEVVRLESELPDGPVEVHAMVRQRNAFRYGMQFGVRLGSCCDRAHMQPVGYGTVSAESETYLIWMNIVRRETSSARVR